MKRFVLFISLLLIISAFISGCGKDNANTEKNDGLKVYTTVYPLQYFAEQIGGEYVNAKTIYPPGADEHTFEPSQKDMIALADADLFLYVGLGLEGFVDKAEKTLKNEDLTMISVGDKIKLDDAAGENGHNGEADSHAEEDGSHEEDDHADDGHDEQGHGDHDGIDPHIWLDPVYANELALIIKNQLIEQMPEQKDTFEKNYEQLAGKLEDLNHEFSEVASSAKRKEIIVSHAAFSYWEKRYGIEQISISGLSTTNEPSQKELKNLITHAKEQNIKYVLNEQNFDSKLAKMVRKEIGAESLTLHNLSVLTDEDVKNSETYFSLMEKNLATLEKALIE